MPDTLNPASVRAACDAMRAAYRPDCILLRPDAMEAAIRAFLAAEREREGEWKETVRKLFDLLHFDREHSIFQGNPLARKIIDIIEDRHRAYFCEPRNAAAIGAKP